MSSLPKVPKPQQQMNFLSPPSADASIEDQLKYANYMHSQYQIRLNNFQQELGLSDYDIARLNSLVQSISFYATSVETWSILLGVQSDV